MRVSIDRKNGSGDSVFLGKRKDPLNGRNAFIQGVLWRRRRDLNPRAGFPTYTLSRGEGPPLFQPFFVFRVSVGVSIGLKRENPCIGKVMHGFYV